MLLIIFSYAVSIIRFDHKFLLTKILPQNWFNFAKTRIGHNFKISHNLTSNFRWKLSPEYLEKISFSSTFHPLKFNHLGIDFVTSLRPSCQSELSDSENNLVIFVTVNYLYGVKKPYHKNNLLKNSYWLHFWSYCKSSKNLSSQFAGKITFEALIQNLLPKTQKITIRTLLLQITVNSYWYLSNETHFLTKKRIKTCNIFFSFRVSSVDNKLVYILSTIFDVRLHNSTSFSSYV